MARLLQAPQIQHSIDESTIGEFIFNRCDEFPNRISQIDATTNQTETFANVKTRAIRIAIALQNLGVTSQDTIAFCSPNTIDIAVTLVGTYFLGAKPANLDPSLSTRHTKHLLNLITPKVIFTDKSSLNLINESLKNASFTPKVIIFSDESYKNLTKVKTNENLFRPSKVNPDEIAVMFFSSGTTGLPKAICHSHKSFLLTLSQVSQIGIYGVKFHFTTFYWVTAMYFFLTSFKDGFPRVFLQNQDVEDGLKAVQKYKIAAMFSSPNLMYQITNIQKTKFYDLSSLRIICCGGTPIAASRLQEAQSIFKNNFICVCYGLSEIGFVAYFKPNDSTSCKLNSCGTLAHGITLKVADLNTDEALGPNQKGEIRLDSNTKMLGYYKQESADAFDKDNFIKTGDVGYYDEDGCIYIVERIKEMFKYKSWHIVPSAIEEVLLEHPDIKQATVFGIPHEDDEIPAACVILKDNAKVTENDIHKFLKGRVAEREELIGGIYFVKELPLTPTGKILRKQARDLILNKLKKM